MNHQGMLDARRKLLAAAVCAALFAAAPAMAQQQGAAAVPQETTGQAVGQGSVSGTVSDPVTGEYLRNAIVRVTSAGGRRTVTSGARGQYQVGNLPAGPVEVSVRFTGYPVLRTQFELAPGESRREDFELLRAGAGAQGDADVTLDTVVVSGVRQGDARAIMEQRASMDIVNSLSAESYGEISEGNPGEFMKFMPGVDTDSSGDGTVRTVGLRGLPPAYTQVMVNGVNLAAADANTGANASRTFSFEQMSLSSIDSIEISKTISADVDANAPAGTINVRTKRAFDRDGRSMMAQVSASTHSNVWDAKRRTGPGEGGYGSKRFLPNYGFEYADVFFDDRLGVVASLSESNLYVEQEQITANRNYQPTAASPDPLAISSIETNVAMREIMRSSATLNMDFRATDNLILSLVTMFNRSGIWAASTNYQFITGARDFGVDGDPVFDIHTRQPQEFNALQVTNSMTYKNGRGRTLVPGFEYANERIRLDGHLSYSDSTSSYDPLGEKGSAHTVSALLAPGNFTATRGDTLLGQSWDIRQTGGVDWNDPAAFTSVDPFIMRLTNGGSAKHTLKGAALNLTFDQDIAGRPVTFKTGLKAKRAEFDYANDSDLQRYRYAGPLGLTELLDAVRTSSQNSFDDSGVRITTLDGHSEPYLPSQYRLAELYRQNPEHWVPTSIDSPAEWYAVHVGNIRDFREDTSALYFMGTADMTDRLTLRAGLRWERTATAALEPDPLSPEEVRAAGFEVVEATGRAATIEGLEYQYLTRPNVERKGRYAHFFPSGSLKYSFDDATDLQIGYSRTIRRPEVGQVTGVWSVDDVERRVVASNPGLEPELSNNLSVRLVRYFEPVGVVGINYYRNRVKGLFQTEEMTAEEFGYTGDEYADYTFVTTNTVDGDAINIHGWELEFSHAMDYLPGWLGGFSVRGSFMRNFPDIPIVRMADKLGTFSLSYQQGGLSMYLNTVWTADKYRSTTPSWFAEYLDTNLSGSYRFSNGVEAFFSVRNLLDKDRNVIVPGSLATTGHVGDHSAIYIHGGRNATIGLRARF
ncbi:TonB-dependent receptor domain-containing protein [Luteimonas dalianensis]|uniref:TonB-dependent receptor n=1 Tax=Luteimonas dalianensis TaxID=1148196 RepID=UPI003BF153B0